MTIRGKYTSTRRADGGWKVPLAIKIGIAVIGVFFILIAIIGTLVHGQSNMTASYGTNVTGPVGASTSDNGIPQSAKGCIGNDQVTDKTYIDLRCLQDPQLNQIVCDNWPGPGSNFTCPNTTVPHNIGVNVTR
jgi:hypothetical protein